MVAARFGGAAVIRRWWLRRSVALRVSAVVALGTFVLLVGLAQIARLVLGALLVDAADTSLADALRTATVQVGAGHPPTPAAPGEQLRVLDTAGVPTDGGPTPDLAPALVQELKAGTAVLVPGDPPRRWLGAVVTAPDGAQRLVAAGLPLTGYGYVTAVAADWLLIASAFGALGAGALSWVAIRTALLPVRRMRAAARTLPAGQRLPVPAARDELRALAEALNALLGRRDEATARLQRFTGDAAHELRSPVASIRAQAEVAVVHPDPDTAQDVLAEVVTESERLSKLVEDLLVLARADGGEPTGAQSVDLAFAVHAALERLGDDGVPVRFEAPAGDCAVLAGAPEVKVVLDNLLRNARRYAHGQITVAVVPIGPVVRLVVDDDGPGVPAEDRAKVFDRFYRVSDDRARDSGGSGLGLALVAELVRQRRGTVRVAEAPLGGARFDIRWPAA